MKKILCTFMLLLWVTAGMALPGKDEQGYYLVSNLQELNYAVNATKDGDGKSYAKIKLIADIYLDGMQNTLCNTFTGKIDGGYSLINSKGEKVELKHVFFGSKEGDEETLKTCSYLFTNLENATIKDVGFYNIRVQSEDRDNMGVIATTATSTTFEQVTLDKCSVFTNCNNAGALVGQAKSCKFFAVFACRCDVTTDGVRAGGFVGNSEENYYMYGGASLGTAVFADGNNWTNGGWSGGIAGYSKNDLFYSMANLALVGADQNFVGGYAGESDGSSFINCQNSGFVLHINEEDSNPKKSFRAQQQKLVQYVSESNLSQHWPTGVEPDKATMKLIYLLNAGGKVDLNSFLGFEDPAPATRGAGAALAVRFLPMIKTERVMEGICEAIIEGFGNTTIVTNSNIIAAQMAAEEAAAATATFVNACVIAAGVAVVIAATVIAIYIFNGDDEVGGICGKATGGFFEQCTNNAYLYCRDDNCGGIVGLGVGVTINNCLNTGDVAYDEEDTSASILGKAEADSNGKKCLVTNCFSVYPFHIVGGEGISDGMDLASGNNYRKEGGKYGTCNWEMEVDDLTMENGTVAYWLNNGVENRSAGIRPWHQDMYGKDKYPVLDYSHAEVTSVPDEDIFTAEQLMEFAKSVNEYGAIFDNATLYCDIDMTGYDWSPIGNSLNRFRGVFNGQGHTIKGLKVNMASDEVGAALFGVVHSNAIIRDVIVDSSCEFTNTKDGGAAGIVGLVNIGWYCGNVLIENCASHATVNGNQHAGGILGRVITGGEDGGPSVKVYVNNCYNMGAITATRGNSGLLCGYTKDHGHISNCWSAGSLKKSTSSSVTPFDAAHNEFFCGYNAKLDIKNCYAIGAESNFEDLGMITTQNGVSRLSSEALPIGSLTYHLNGDQNDATKSLTWQQNLGTDAYPVFGSKGVFHTRTVSNEIGTVCLPFTLKSDDAISYYAFTGASTDADNATSLNFEYVETVAPGQPALFRVASTGDITFSDAVGNSWSNAPTSTDQADWTLRGTFAEKKYTLETSTNSKTIYYVSGGAIKNAKQVTIKLYRAFFSGPNIDDLKNSPSGARIRIVIDGVEDETSATKLIADVLAPQLNSKAYSLLGTEVNDSYRGIVIRNGKKYINR